MCGRKSLVALAFLLVCVLPLFSEEPSVAEMSDTAILKELLRLQDEREKALDERESLLMQSEAALNGIEQELQDLKTSLTERERSMSSLIEKLNETEKTVGELENYSKSLSEELRKRNRERNLSLLAAVIGWALFLINVVL